MSGVKGECLSILLSEVHLHLKRVIQLLPCYPLSSKADQHRGGGEDSTNTIQEVELHFFFFFFLPTPFLAPSC